MKIIIFMTTKDVADRLVKLCRENMVEEAKQEFFTEETLSIEPVEGILPKETKGLKAIEGKAKLFISMVEQFFGSAISDPVIAGDYFSVAWDTDIQMKGGQRNTSSELCVTKWRMGKLYLNNFSIDVFYFL